jgi:hypothetical protein
LKDLKKFLTDVLQYGFIQPGTTTWAHKVKEGRLILSDSWIHQVLLGAKSGAPALRKAEILARSYQAITLKSLSPKQRDKFVNAVEKPYDDNKARTVNILTENYYAHRFPKQLARLASNYKEETYVPLCTLPQSASLRTPVWVSSRKDLKSITHFEYASGHYLGNELAWLISSSSQRFIPPADKDVHEDILSCLTGKKGLAFQPMMFTGGMFAMGPSHVEPTLVGSVAFLQEGGCKLRSIANPRLIFQLLGDRLMQRLERLSKCHSGIATFDQGEGHRFAAEKLKSGCTLFSFDLSSFTDRFPYQIQKEVLRTLQRLNIVAAWEVGLVDFVTKGSWKTPLKDKSRIKWAVGQPLGFRPSFHLATLTHALVLDNITKDLGIDPNCYRVVGDDVIISDKQVAEAYGNQMNSTGVEINLSKSLVSNAYAEFCGKLICEEGVSPSLKTRPFTLENIVSRLDHFGPTILPFIRSKDLRRRIFGNLYRFGEGDPKLTWSFVRHILKDARVQGAASQILLDDKIRQLYGKPYCYQDMQSSIQYSARVSESLSHSGVIMRKEASGPMRINELTLLPVVESVEVAGNESSSHNRVRSATNYVDSFDQIMRDAHSAKTNVELPVNNGNIERFVNPEIATKRPMSENQHERSEDERNPIRRGSVTDPRSQSETREERVTREAIQRNQNLWSRESGLPERSGRDTLRQQGANLEARSKDQPSRRATNPGSLSPLPRPEGVEREQSASAHPVRQIDGSVGERPRSENPIGVQGDRRQVDKHPQSLGAVAKQHPRNCRCRACDRGR